MDIRTTYLSGRLTLYLTGELDHHEARCAIRTIDELMDEYLPRDCVLDLNGLSFMDSSGIGVVLGRYRLLCLRGGSVALMHLTPQVRRIYDLSGMAQIIPVIEEKEAQGCN